MKIADAIREQDKCCHCKRPLIQAQGKCICCGHKARV